MRERKKLKQRSLSTGLFWKALGLGQAPSASLTWMAGTPLLESHSRNLDSGEELGLEANSLTWDIGFPNYVNHWVKHPRLFCCCCYCKHTSYMYKTRATLNGMLNCSTVASHMFLGTSWLHQEALSSEWSVPPRFV